MTDAADGPSRTAPDRSTVAASPASAADPDRSPEVASPGRTAERDDPTTAVSPGSAAKPEVPREPLDDAALQARARALTSPLRLRILRLCAYESRTNKELARLLDVNPGTMLHHVRTLVATDLLRPEEPREGRRGAREVPYRATGKSWTTPWFPGTGRALLDTVIQQAADVDAEEELYITWLGLRLNDEHRAELRRRLGELAIEFKERGPDPDGDDYALALMFHPERTPGGRRTPGDDLRDEP